MRRWLHWLTLPIAAILLLFNLRRLIFTFVALFNKSAPEIAASDSSLIPHPSSLILIPCRNEAATLLGLIDCLDRVEYPADRLHIALIDDGSIDATGEIIDQAARARSNWTAIHLAINRGKPKALNDALSQIEFGEVIVVYDVDHRPEPDSLVKLIAAFDDPFVAGASGRTKPINPTASWPAYYATVESLVHQLITMRAKDQLDLAPALLGSNCAYRRSALLQAGGFRSGALLEDSDLTVRLTRFGYRLRFVPESIAWHQMPESIEGYIEQHMRWSRGFNDVARDHLIDLLRDRAVPPRVRIESAIFALGYLDRLALLSALGMQLIDRIFGSGFYFTKSILQLSLIMPLIQIAAIFKSERVSISMWRRFPVIPLLFGLDIFVAVRSMLESLLNRPRVWTKTQRLQELNK
ncbi:MAG TPA: glycosyltransferase [Anaerolineae bacterium]|nr:glycosyltransferase [Anaerolineae bacterium]